MKKNPKVSDLLSKIKGIESNIKKQMENPKGFPSQEVLKSEMDYAVALLIVRYSELLQRLVFETFNLTELACNDKMKTFNPTPGLKEDIAEIEDYFKLTNRYIGPRSEMAFGISKRLLTTIIY